MKKKGTQLFISALAAGIVATSGITSAVTISRNTETTETVEYTMEENAYDNELRNLEKNYLAFEQYDSLNQVIQALPKGCGYKIIHSIGYDGDILVVAGSITKINGKNTSNSIHFYTKKHGEHVKCIGHLVTAYRDPILYKDGIIHTSYIGASKSAYTTYIVTPDGQSVVKKDDIFMDFHYDIPYYAGYTKKDAYSEEKYYYNNSMEQIKKTQKEIENTPVIDFDIK